MRVFVILFLIIGITCSGQNKLSVSFEPNIHLGYGLWMRTVNYSGGGSIGYTAQTHPAYFFGIGTSVIGRTKKFSFGLGYSIQGLNSPKIFDFAADKQLVIQPIRLLFGYAIGANRVQISPGLEFGTMLNTKSGVIINGGIKITKKSENAFRFYLFPKIGWNKFKITEAGLFSNQTNNFLNLSMEGGCSIFLVKD